MNFDPRFYLTLLVRRLPLVVLIFLVTTMAGVFMAYTLPPVYRAEARLLVESPQIPDELAASTVRTTPTEVLLGIQQRILSTTNMLDLAAQFDIYADAPELPEGARVADMRSRITMATPSIDQRTGVLTVSFSAPDPGLSSSVTNALVDQILRQNVELRTDASGGTLEFFEQEVKRLSSEIAAQNARILEFEQANRNALPESLEFRRSRQAAQQEQLLQVNRELAGLRDRRQRLQDLYERTGRIGPSGTDLTPEQQRLEALRQELASALVIYAPENPRVRALQTQVEALEQSVREQLGTGTGDGALSTFELQVADIDGQIAFMADQKRMLEEELARIAESIEQTPENAIVLGELESDFVNLRVQYDQAVQSLADARMGDRIEVTARGQRIVVVDPAIPPVEPSEPNRKLIVAAGFGAGLLLTMLMLFLTDVLNRTVRRPVELVSSLGITPFGTIPYIATEEEVRRQRFRSIGMGVAGLICLPLLLYAFTVYLSSREEPVASAAAPGEAQPVQPEN
ncbi:GumC family protein [Paragemmobacter ruber]|uniref:Lipopolysaccharide biosynthesis protein n=1 Tax=Paragemmobacter ruber TaxID=1985673 RepID=A0ABW9Y227_9RHOB|nr:Wzz/FepE/Etk N-terminal domain-containing protein [Rhodobacter ruber]NBE06565.1 lipopolysaccharide biosynthesis protein [Rhodobacter ruber]